MPETEDGYTIDDSILDGPITVEELLLYLETLEELDGEDNAP